MNPWDDDTGYDEWIEDLLRNTPESWGSSEGSAESIISDYLHELERRVQALGGSLERWPGAEVAP